MSSTTITYASIKQPLFSSFQNGKKLVFYQPNLNESEIRTLEQQEINLQKYKETLAKRILEN